MTTTEERLSDVFRRKFPNAGIALKHYGKLFLEYAESGLSPPHLISEIETDDDGKFWSYLWEAMLYRHFGSQGCNLRSTGKPSGQDGPDFCIDHHGLTIWIEAIVPSPEGIPADWLASLDKDKARMWTKPHEQMLLRCTSAIAAKRDKIATYQAKGTISPNDCAVIAVSICRLSRWDVDGNGISQLPLVVEAVFPVGPLGVPITHEGKIDGPAQHIPRFTVPNKNGAAIPTYAFLDARFENISAVIQGHQKDLISSNLLLSTIHNPRAAKPLPEGLFGGQKEFVARADGDNYQLQDIVA